MIIDAHQHVWDPQRAEYPWLAAEHPAIRRAIGPDEVLPDLRENGIGASVLVQSADNDEDTELMLEVAAGRPDVVGVVVHVPLADPGGTAARLARWGGDPLVVGVRTLIHTLPDPDWVLRPEVGRSLELVAAAGLSFDLVSVLPRHLEHAPTLAAQHPDLRIVIDHLSKPPVGRRQRQPWWDLLARAAEHPLVHAKVSGLYAAEGDPADFSSDLVAPFVEHARTRFGADRLMFGSDWPICLPLGGYGAVCRTLLPLFASWSETDRREVLSGTASRCYRLAPPA